MSLSDNYIFDLDEIVTRTPVSYKNRFGIRIAAGFVALTFDPSFNGFSGGEPRHVSSPDIFVEDFSAAVDYLGHATVRRPGAHRRDRHVRQRRAQPQRGADRPAHQ